LTKDSFRSRKNGRIQCVIYDCDGVLFDSLEANRRFYNDLCCAVRQTPLLEEELRYAHVHTTREAIKFFFRGDSELEGKAVEYARRFDPGAYVSHLIMEPNLLPTLAALGEKKIFRAVNTNRTASMKAIIENFHLEPFFDLVTTARDVKNPKPHPESVERILQTFALDKTEVVFIGDSEIDQQAAEGAGVKFIAYKNRGLRADNYIEDHREILPVIDSSDGR
jgi:phosphoglycolate phosphatase